MKSSNQGKALAEMADISSLIETITRGHKKTCDATKKRMESMPLKTQQGLGLGALKATACPMKGNLEDSVLDQSSEHFMEHVRQVCSFAKLIPGFKRLAHEDQVTLLKACIFEVLLVRLSGYFDDQNKINFNGVTISKEAIHRMPPGNARQLMNSIFEVTQKIRNLGLSDSETGLFSAVVIITPDRQGLKNPDLVQCIQGRLKSVLHKVLLDEHPDQASTLSELMNINHELRKLNAIHTEKFLLQSKMTPNGPPLGTARQITINQYQPMWEIDRESAGNGSPQSSDANSSSSLEDTSSRRSPLSSVSSSESIGPSEISKLTTQDLRVNGSVLMNALTAPPSSSACATLITAVAGLHNTKATYREVLTVPNPNRLSNKSQLRIPTTAAITGALLKTRKLDSSVGSPSCPSSSTHSANTSICSSPRLLSEDLREADVGQRKASDVQGSLEEKHPLLKRALEQPPQIYNMQACSFFEEDVPHKRIRSGLGDAANSAQSATNERRVNSLIASQLAEPPMYQFEREHDQQSSGYGTSLLASALSRATTLILSEESRRNEILARLILEGNPLQRYSSLAGPSSRSPADYQTASGQEAGLNTVMRTTSSPWWKYQTGPAASGAAECLSKRPASPVMESKSATNTDVGMENSQAESHPLNLSTRTASQPTSKTQSSNLDIQIKA